LKLFSYFDYLNLHAFFNSFKFQQSYGLCGSDRGWQNLRIDRIWCFLSAKSTFIFSPLKTEDNYQGNLNFQRHVTLFLQFSACFIAKKYLLFGNDVVFFI